MDNKSFCEQKDIDEKIKQLEEFHTEVECFIESLKQMHQNATNVCATLKNLEKKNEK